MTETTSDGRPAPGRLDVLARIADWSDDEVFALHLRWVARYLPIWFAVLPTFAEAAQLTDEKRALHEERMRGVLDLTARRRAGERVLTKHLAETESAISLVTNRTAHYRPSTAWAERARSAALTARQLLQHSSHEPSGRAIVASALYGWAEIETAFPGDAAALLARLTMEERLAVGPDTFDGHHLLYGRPARERGLGAEGQAVYDEAAHILDRLEDDPGPFVVDDAFWDSSPAIAARQRAEEHARFHGRAAPPWPS